MVYVTVRFIDSVSASVCHIFGTKVQIINIHTEDEDTAAIYLIIVVCNFVCSERKKYRYSSKD